MNDNQSAQIPEAWCPIDTAPLDGTEVYLGNERDPSSMRIDGFCPTFGRFDGECWQISSFFIVPGGRHGLIASQPTHWRPKGEGELA